MTGRAIWIALAVATLIAVAAGFALDGLLAAWKWAIVLLAGLALGSLALFMVGRILGNDWHEAIDDELIPAAWTILLVALLALPLIALPTPDAVAIIGEAAMAPLRSLWFDPAAIQARIVSAFLLWIALCAVTLRRGAPRWVSAVGLALLAASFSSASIDWVLLAEPFWWSSLFPFAFAIAQMTAALAIAFVVHLAQGEKAPEHRLRSLASALLALALLELWLWFVQYLIAWMANLPAEAAWYAARREGSALLVAAAMLQIAGIVILIGFDRTRVAMLCASVALLAAHLFHGLWLLRPSAAGWPVIPILVLLWSGWLVAGVRHYDRRRLSGGERAPPPPDRGAGEAEAGDHRRPDPGLGNRHRDE